MLRVRVLGELVIEVDGRVVEPPTSRRARALLGLLAVDRRVHARRELAARWWPDVLDESARTSLRSALSALRKAIGPDAGRYVVASRDSVGLPGEELVWTDVSEFQSLLAEGKVQDALALCRGELLQGLDEDWIYQARDEHRECVAQALARMAAEAEERGELGEAVALTRRQVALDPLVEEAQRDLIRRLGAAGDRPAALSAYRRLQDRLRSELGIAPSTQTRKLVESLRADSGSARRAGGIGAPAPADEAGATSNVVAPPSDTVTLLFTDQVSSSETFQRLGDDETDRLRRAQFALLRDVAGRHSGREVKNLGDGLVVSFASAVDAVACAIGIQRVVHRHAERSGDAGFAVRVGLNVGERIIDEGDYFGTPVVVAKRLCDAADGGQIIASEVVRALVGTRGGFEFRTLGAVRLKGIAEPVAACEVGWEPAATQPAPLPPAVTEIDTAPFIGRADLLETLGRHWAAVAGGERRVVLLAGEPGIGKTRLAAEFCAAAYADGAAVLAGRCYEERLLPYQPFAEALRHYLGGCPPGELTVHVGPRRRELATLLPELGHAGRAKTSDTGRDAGAERFRLFEAVASLLAGVSLARPTVLVLDDLHWADEASLLLLRHIARATEGSELLILGTYRKTELDRGELASTLAELRRARALHQLDLEGLPEVDVAALIGARSGKQAQESFARQVTERTEGNPLFIEELLRHVDDPAGAVLCDPALPDSIKELLLRRLGRLSESCRRALDVAAVAGREFDLNVLERLVGGSIEELAEVLEGAVRGHVLVEEASAIGRYRFAHPLIRETIYGDISVTRRALLHRRVGEAIESLCADRLDQHAGMLAHHYRAAGDADKAFEYHRRAADEAERGNAPETAFEQLTGAIATGELLGHSARTDGVMRELHLRRAWVAQFTRIDVGLSKRDYVAALQGARATGDRALEMRALNGLGIYWHVRDSTNAMRCHEQSLKIAEELSDQAGQVAALSRLSLLCGNRLDLQRALDLGERALALARASGEERAVARAMDSLKFVALMLGDMERLEELTTQMALIQRRRQDIWFLQWTLLESAFVPIAAGRWEEAARRLDEAFAINRRMGDLVARSLILSFRCSLERLRGEYGRALELGRQSALATPNEFGRVWLGWTAGTLARVLGDLRAWPEALETLEAGLAATRRLEERVQSFSVLGDIGWIRLQAGDEAGARVAADRWDAIVCELRTPPGRAHVYAAHSYVNRARTALGLGEVEQAQNILLGVRAPIERSGIRAAAAEADATLGACALARGDPSTAEELLARGLRAAGDRELPAQRLELRIALARLARSPETAATHADAARTLIEQIAQSVGDAWLANRFRDSALTELEQPAPAPRQRVAAIAGSRQETS